MIFYFYKYEDGFWFRLFGYGFSFSKTASFSDRYFNRKKYLGYYVRFLKPFKP